ncbi:MAG: type I-E CRISPR-associated protein Cas6/Cse3/CasE [Methylohalobius sp. ZOD2]
MYLTRITLLDRPDLNRLRELTGNAYREHQMLWRLFEDDPDATRDFLYRREIQQGRPRYFLLSRRPPVNHLGWWHIDRPKPFKPKLRQGQRLGFTLRVNPIVSRRDENGKLKRHDVVMDLKIRRGWQEQPKSNRQPLPALIQEAGIDWLTHRTERHGFDFDPDQIQVDAYHQHRFRKNGSGKAIHLSTLDFAGIVTVTDPAKFIEETLCKGIGPAKAFGCGLMLVRRLR